MGFNCAQGVFAACCDLSGLDEKTALAIAGGFGGGMRCGSVCGAVTGAMMALGACCPYNKEGDEAANRRITQLTLELQKRFVQEYGDLNCAKLLKMSVSEAKASGQAKKICPRLIETACGLVEELIK